MSRAIRITSASGALTVNVTGPAGTAPVVYADSAFSATTSLPATIADGTTSTLWLKSPGAYTLSVKTSSGTEIAADNNTTRTVDLETDGTVAALSYDTRFTHRIEGDSGRGSDTGDTNAAYVPLGSGHYDVAVQFGGNGFVNGVSATADTAAAVACLAQIAADVAAGRATRRMFFGPGDWKINPDQLQVNFRGLIVEGHAGARPDQMGGTRLYLTGAGALFQFGTDNGLAYDGRTYDGAGDYYTFRDIMFDVLAPTTALANGAASYTPGTYAVRDWRGGDALFERCRFEHFDFYFWGVQSDQNRWVQCRYLYNHSGGYFGPNCDQQTFIDPETWGNDRFFKFDAASGIRFVGGNLVGNGAAATNPYCITSGFASEGSTDIEFLGTWFEHHQLVATIEAMFEIGIDGATAALATCSGIRWYGCHTSTQASGGGNFHAQNFAKLANADRLFVDSITSGVPFDNFFKFTGSTSPRVMCTASQDVTAAFLSTNAGTGTPEIDRWSWGNGHFFSSGKDVVTMTVQGVTGQASALAKFKDGNGNDKIILDPNGHIACQRDLIVNGIGFTGGFTGGGFGILGIQNAITVPTSNPTGGGVIYAEAGALKYRGSSGTVTVLGPA